MNKVKDVFLWKIKLIYTIINSEKKSSKEWLRSHKSKCHSNILNNKVPEIIT